MRLASSLPLAAAILALLPGAVHGKEVASARACDPDGCRTITDRGALRGMEEGAPASAPQQGAPFHRIRMTVKVGGTDEFAYTMAYVPAAGLLRVRGEGGGYEWLAPTPRGLRGFERLTRGLEPLPASRLRGVGSAEEPPTAKVDSVVPAPVPASEDGLPWQLLLLLPVGGVLAWMARRPKQRRLRRTGERGALARDELS